MCQPSRCSPKGVDTRWCVSKDAGPQRGVDLVEVPHRIGERNEWAPKGGGFGGGPASNWRKERVPARTLGPEGGWIVMSHIGWGGEQNTEWKPSPSKRVLKP